ncbi:MAG: hypothetical protein ACOYI5_00265 [Christensenellales bacterium]|jgi:hypothetical protein
MALNARYIVALAERADAGADMARAAIARLEADETLARTAKRRARYEKDDRWWSVVAGVLIIVMSVLYSANLTVAAHISAVVLCVYVVVIFSYIIAKRALLKRTEPPISPTRALDALFRGALGLPARANDPVRLYDGARLAQFSRDLAAQLIPLARAAGVEPEHWTVSVEVNPRLVEGASSDIAAIPAVATATCADASGARVEFLLEYFATFVSAAGGDTRACDEAPAILGAIARMPQLPEEPASRVVWTAHPQSGARVSERYQKAASD